MAREKQLPGSMGIQPGSRGPQCGGAAPPCFFLAGDKPLSSARQNKKYLENGRLHDPRQPSRSSPSYLRDRSACENTHPGATSSMDATPLITRSRANRRASFMINCCFGPRVFSDKVNAPSLAPADTARRSRIQFVFVIVLGLEEMAPAVNARRTYGKHPDNIPRRREIGR